MKIKTRKNRRRNEGAENLKGIDDLHARRKKNIWKLVFFLEAITIRNNTK